MNSYFVRSAMVLGEGAEELLNSKSVAVFGLGGVGGMCCEALARSGIGRLLIIDGDTVVESNLNRQIIATKQTVGRNKTDARAGRIESISDCTVRKCNMFVMPDDVEAVLPSDIDYIVDAIDTVSTKLALIKYAYEKHIPMISCMGMGNRLDPTKIEIRDIYNTSVCPLARTIRIELRKAGIESLNVAFSTEIPVKPIPLEQAAGRRSTPGSTSFVPPAAGLAMASFVIRDLCSGVQSKGHDYK